MLSVWLLQNQQKTWKKNEEPFYLNTHISSKSREKICVVQNWIKPLNNYYNRHLIPFLVIFFVIQKLLNRFTLIQNTPQTRALVCHWLTERFQQMSQYKLKINVAKIERGNKKKKKNFIALGYLKRLSLVCLFLLWFSFVFFLSLTSL